MENNIFKPENKIIKWIKRILMFFGIIFIFNIVLGIILMLSRSPLETVLDNYGLTRNVVRSGSPDSVIVMIHLTGIIGSQGFLESDLGSNIRTKLEMLKYEEALKAVIIVIDSPGGSATESDIIYNRLKSIDVPKVALLGNLAASGGYYVAAGCDQIIAHPTTLTGSIGAIMQFPEVSGLLENLGIEMLTVKSGPHKDMQSYYRKPDPVELEILQEAVNEVYNKFIESVSEGRNMSIEQVKSIADGRILSANKALEYGLIDSIGYREDAVKKAEELAGETDCLIVTYDEKQSFFEMIGVSQKNDAIPLTVIQEILETKGPLFLYTY
jgi:protease IV